MTETLSRDLDLVHAATSDVVLETQSLAVLSISSRSSKRLHQVVVLEDIQGFFEGLEVVGAQEDERGSSVASDQDAVVLTFDPVGQFREVGLDFRERKRVAHMDRLQVTILTYTRRRQRDTPIPRCPRSGT